MFTKLKVSALAVFAAVGLAAQPSLASDGLFKDVATPQPMGDERPRLR